MEISALTSPCLVMAISLKVCVQCWAQFEKGNSEERILSDCLAMQFHISLTTKSSFRQLWVSILLTGVDSNEHNVKLYVTDWNLLLFT